MEYVAPAPRWGKHVERLASSKGPSPGSRRATDRTNTDIQNWHGVVMFWAVLYGARRRVRELVKKGEGEQAAAQEQEATWE